MNQYFFSPTPSSNKSLIWKRGDAETEVVPSRPFGVQGKNAEQSYFASALMNPEIPVVTCLGKAGSGKTFLAIAAAMQHIEDKKADEILIMRPMSETGRWKMGALPGDINEKMGPFLQGYHDNMEQLFNLKNRSRGLDGAKTKGATMDFLAEKFPTRIMPLQYIRGASWVNKIVVVDEAQVLNKEEILAIGSRVGEGTKLVLLGDLKQRDGQIAEKDSGLKYFIEHTQDSPLVYHCNLIKCQRSAVADLFINVMDG